MRMDHTPQPLRASPRTAGHNVHAFIIRKSSLASIGFLSLSLGLKQAARSFFKGLIKSTKCNHKLMQLQAAPVADRTRFGEDEPRMKLTAKRMACVSRCELGYWLPHCILRSAHYARFVVEFLLEGF